MRVIPKQQSLDAFHFATADDFIGLLRFVRNDATGKIDGRLRMDGASLEALVTLATGNMKVNGYEWVLRTEEGIYRTMGDSEFQETYQQAPLEKRTKSVSIQQVAP